MTLIIDVKCDVCGEDLETRLDDFKGLLVEPCETCMQDNYNRGVDEGDELGYKAGYQDGLQEAEDKQEGGDSE